VECSSQPKLFNSLMALVWTSALLTSKFHAGGTALSLNDNDLECGLVWVDINSGSTLQLGKVWRHVKAFSCLLASPSSVRCTHRKAFAAHQGR